MERSCSRGGCSRQAFRRRGNAHYCVIHTRISEMRCTAQRDGKLVPPWEQLESLAETAVTCAGCNRAMNWLSVDGASTVVTLQHDRDGGIRLICLSCNSRHGAHPGDSFYEIPQGFKRCGRCHEIKSEDQFYRDYSKRWHDLKSACKKCGDAAMATFRENNRAHCNAYQRKYRARRKAQEAVS